MKVVHCKKSAYDVYIGRPSSGPWNYGNPFEIGIDGNRDEVINKYEKWLTTGENFGNMDATEARRQWILEHLKDLKGQVLGCWCSPKRCHGDILLKLLKEIK